MSSKNKTQKFESYSNELNIFNWYIIITAYNFLHFTSSVDTFSCIRASLVVESLILHLCLMCIDIVYIC